MHVQVGRALAKPPVRSANDLPSASSLVAAIHKLQQHVLQLHAREGMSAKLARSLHDLALACTIFGHLPPLRLSCIRTLMVPSYKGPCLNPECKLGPTCHGNQLQLKPEQGLHMHVPHHKNERNWSRAAISFVLPPELDQLLKLHLRQGWQLLTTHHGVEGACHVFVDKHGRAFTPSSLPLYWNQLLQSMSMPPMPPSQCRQVFVAERRSEARVAGPNDRGAAMVMGHSVQQWDKWYDLDFHARQAQQAVDAMSTWRQTLLAQAAQHSPNPSL